MRVCCLFVTSSHPSEAALGFFPTSKGCFPGGLPCALSHLCQSRGSRVPGVCYCQNLLARLNTHGRTGVGSGFGITPSSLYCPNLSIIILSDLQFVCL